jgi:hypothetical protein
MPFFHLCFFWCCILSTLLIFSHSSSQKFMEVHPSALSLFEFISGYFGLCIIHNKLKNTALNQIGLLKTRRNLNSSDWAPRTDITAVPTKFYACIWCAGKRNICMDFTAALNPSGYPTPVLDNISFITGKLKSETDKINPDTVGVPMPNASWLTCRPSKNWTKQICNTVYHLYMGERNIIQIEHSVSPVYEP